MTAKILYTKQNKKFEKIIVFPYSNKINIQSVQSRLNLKGWE